jgi:hypothetical protein
MKTRILLTNKSEDSQKAKLMLTNAEVPFDELPAHPIWEEIEYPIPSFFVDDEIHKGLEEIELMIEVLGYGKPS